MKRKNLERSDAKQYRAYTKSMFILSFLFCIQPIFIKELDCFYELSRGFGYEYFLNRLG